MKEHVGLCQVCKKDVYCMDGFLDGYVDEDGKLICTDCSHKEQEQTK